MKKRESKGERDEEKDEEDGNRNIGKEEWKNEEDGGEE